MSRAATLSNYEIRAEGWRALTERLGVAGAIRFFMEYDPLDDAICARQAEVRRRNAVGLPPRRHPGEFSPLTALFTSESVSDIAMSVERG